jgi:hypothetical protein
VISGIGAHPILASGIPRTWEHAVSGFRLTANTSSDLQWYAVEAREEGDRFYAYRSDASGLIVRVRDIVDLRPGQVSLRTEAFVKRPRTTVVRVVSAAMALLNSVIPTVYALDDHTQCCINCGDHNCWPAPCGANCPIAGGARCCNLGYLDCVNCCASPGQTCACAWDECPPKND